MIVNHICAFFYVGRIFVSSMAQLERQVKGTVRPAAVTYAGNEKLGSAPDFWVMVGGVFRVVTIAL